MALSQWSEPCKLLPRIFTIRSPKRLPLNSATWSETSESQPGLTQAPSPCTSSTQGLSTRSPSLPIEFSYFFRIIIFIHTAVQPRNPAHPRPSPLLLLSTANPYDPSKSPSLVCWSSFLHSPARVLSQDSVILHHGNSHQPITEVPAPWWGSPPPAEQSSSPPICLSCYFLAWDSSLVP